jgi:hypothetical protein
VNKPFRDLKIAGVRTKESFVVKGNVVRIYLRLDGNPPLGWSYTFSQVWQVASYPQKAPAGADGDSIWVDCVPNELKALHLTELERAVATTNARFRDWQQEKEAARSKLEGLDSATKTQLDDLGKTFDKEPPPIIIEKKRSRIAMWLGVFCIYWLITGFVVFLWIAAKGERTANRAPVILGWLFVLLVCALLAYADFRRGRKARGKRNDTSGSRLAETTP